LSEHAFPQGGRSDATHNLQARAFFGECLHANRSLSNRIEHQSCKWMCKDAEPGHVQRGDLPKVAGRSTEPPTPANFDLLRTRESDHGNVMFARVHLQLLVLPPGDLAESIEDPLKNIEHLSLLSDLPFRLYDLREPNGYCISSMPVSFIRSRASSAEGASGPCIHSPNCFSSDERPSTPDCKINPPTPHRSTSAPWPSTNIRGE
jgi:hypothetical protein